MRASPCCPMWLPFGFPHYTHTLLSCCSFAVYDADAYAPARFLLPARLASSSTAANASSSLQPGDAAAQLSLGLPQPAPGMAGRWRLPEDRASGLDAMAAMMLRMQQMYSTYVLYYTLQALVLVGLMVRLIMYISFQRRLSVIGGTLVSSRSDLGVRTLGFADLSIEE